MGSDRAFSTFVSGSCTLLALGGFAWLFLGATPVEEVRHLYWGLHLDALMELDALFALCHVLVYAVLTVVLARRTPTAGGWLRILVALTAAGAGLECLQEVLGGRTFSLDDLLANLCGVLLGFLVVIVAGPRFVRRRR